MSQWVVLVVDYLNYDETEVRDVIGPFATEEEAKARADEVDRVVRGRGGDRGYAAEFEMTSPENVVKPRRRRGD